MPYCTTDDETDGSAHLEEFDPAKIYTMEDFMAEEEIIEKIELRISDSIKARTAANASGRRRCRRRGGTRIIIPRNREAGHEDIVANYFSDNPIYTNK